MENLERLYCKILEFFLCITKQFEKEIKKNIMQENRNKYDTKFY